MSIPTQADILAAAERLAPHLGQPTPLFCSAALSELLDADIWLKVETTGPIASFKLRGALNALLTATAKPTAAVTASTGNHGQGVAYAARLLGIPADIFVPEGCVAEKLAAIRRFGGKLHIGGADIDAAKDMARRHAAAIGGEFVDDGESSSLIAGAATAGLEIGQGLEGIEIVLVPMGSGSLAGGTGLGVKIHQPQAKVWAVQSEGAPAMVESYHARRPVERDIRTVGDCIVCRVPAVLALETLLQAVDDAFLVPEASLLPALHTAAIAGRILVEPGATAGLAGAWQRRAAIKGKRVVILLTGANVAAALLSQAMAGPDLQAFGAG
ncbi:MAG: threonine ammonia-lyase [Pseudomonadota bacterium]